MFNFSSNKFGRINLSENKYKNLLKIFYREGGINIDILKDIFYKTTYSDIIKHIYKFSKNSSIDFIIKARFKDSQNSQYDKLHELNSDLFICRKDTLFYPTTESSFLINSSKKMTKLPTTILFTDDPPLIYSIEWW